MGHKRLFVLLAVLLILAGDVAWQKTTGSSAIFEAQSAAAKKARVVKKKVVKAKSKKGAVPTAQKASGTVLTHFGAVIRPFALDKAYAPYNKANLLAQLDLLKDLGATDVIANIEDNTSVNDDFVNLSLERNLQPILIIEKTLPDFFRDASYDQAYWLGRTIAERYKGKVHTYQLANEASGMVIKPTFPGNNRSDYDDAEYAVLKEWLAGLSNGIYDGDKTAQRMLTANWLGTGIVDRLVSDGLSFERAGWHWYSDMGTSMIKQIGRAKFLNVPGYITTKYKKDFWVTEANRREGDTDGDGAAQAEYINALLTNIAQARNVSGFFVFTLTDLCAKLDVEEGHMGLVKLNKNADGSCSLGDKKPAYQAYKDAIAHYRQ